MGKAKDDLPDGRYRGLANQTSFIQRNPNAPTRTVGPVQGGDEHSDHHELRNMATRYLHGLQKDRYASSTIISHPSPLYPLGSKIAADMCLPTELLRLRRQLRSFAREDYKHGWQLDKEWEEVNQGEEEYRRYGGGQRGPATAKNRQRRGRR